MLEARTWTKNEERMVTRRQLVDRLRHSFILVLICMTTLCFALLSSFIWLCLATATTFLRRSMHFYGFMGSLLL